MSEKKQTKYLELLRQKPEDVLLKLKQLFAPRKDRSALQSAIQNTFIEMEGIKEEIRQQYIENFGKWSDILKDQMKKYEELRKKEFILNHLKNDYKEWFGKDYDLNSDDDE
jgi:hypothetical protein